MTSQSRSAPSLSGRALLLAAATVGLLLTALPPGAAAKNETGESGTASTPDSSDDSDDRTPSAEQLLRRADGIVSRVAKIRGLPPKRPIQKGVKSRDELRKILVKKLRQEKSDRQLRREAQVYRKLGLLPPDLNYREALLDVLTEQVAGFYDEKKDRLNIMAGMPLSMQRPALAHEILHALQDQHFDLRRLMKPFDATENGDFSLARSALVEGDATVLMIDYYLHRDGTLPRNDVDSVVEIPAMAQMLRRMNYQNMSALQQLSTSVGGGGSGANPSRLKNSALSEAPAIIRRGLIFPYFAGMDFVIAMRKGRSWSDFDQIYRNPPVSTEQILHPRRYARGDYPVHLTYRARSSLPTEQYRRIYDNVLGEFQLRLFLEHHLGGGDRSTADSPTESVDVDRATTGWDGDRIRAFRRKTDGRVVVTHLSTWDTRRDAGEYYNALVAVAKRRFPGAAVHNERGEHGASTCLYVENATSSARPSPQRIYIERWGDAVLQIEGTPADRGADGAERNGTTYRLRDEIWKTKQRRPFLEVLEDERKEEADREKDEG
ncbi:MAG: hypothetical protein ABEL76_03165 [Bradymonadaceae bacterium]